MFEVKFKIKHKDCWTRNLHRFFNSYFISYLTFSLRKGLSSDIIHISNKNDHEFGKIILYLKGIKLIKNLEILSKDSNNLYLQIYTDVSRIKSIIGTIISYGGFVDKPYCIVLETALNFGYYKFPRWISAQDIAKKLKISKATLLQHLRVAESKIINNNYLS